MGHSQSFLANQKARNAILGAENLLKRVKGIIEPKSIAAKGPR